MRRAQFQKNGVLAMPKASLFSFFDYGDPKPFKNCNGIGVVEICGPMTHHAEWFWDNYDSIAERTNAAFASPDTTAVILKIDSPGGDCSGCYETVRSLRAMAAKSGKKLFAYADGMAASGGYALACAAEEIYLPDTGFVGSIGVVQSLIDMSEMNAKHGVRIDVIASGAKKSIGNPDVPIDEAAIAEVTDQVNTLAEMFFTLVGESRTSMSVDQIRALEAGIFLGQKAVSVGLADGICTFEELLAMVVSKTNTTPVGDAKKATKMSWKEEMQKAADEGDDEAKKALAALDDEAEPKDGDEDGKKKDSKKAEGDAAPADDKDKDAKKNEEPKKEDKEASAVAAPFDAKMVNELQRLSAKDEANERAKIMASRPDIKNATVLSLLAGVPLEQLQKAVDGIDRPKGAANPAAAASVTGTRGANEGSFAANVDPTIADNIDRRMGVKQGTEKIHWKGSDRILPSNLSRESAREILKTNADRVAVRVAGGAK